MDGRLQARNKAEHERSGERTVLWMNHAAKIMTQRRLRFIVYYYFLTLLKRVNFNLLMQRLFNVSAALARFISSLVALIELHMCRRDKIIVSSGSVAGTIYLEISCIMEPRGAVVRVRKIKQREVDSRNEQRSNYSIRPLFCTLMVSLGSAGARLITKEEKTHHNTVTLTSRGS